MRIRPQPHQLWAWLVLVALSPAAASPVPANAGAQEPLRGDEEAITLEVPSASTSPADSPAPTQPAAEPPAVPESDAAAGAAGEESGQPSSAGDELDPAETLVNANRAYEAAQYTQAVEFYNQVLEAGAGDGRIFYNLGNAYLRNGQLGYAIAAYRRAAALRPRDQEIAANLAFARKSTRNDLAPPTASQLQQTLFFWHYRLSRSELLRLLVLANLALWAFLALRRLHPDSEVVRWLSMVALILVIAFGTSLALRLARPSRVAVVLPQEIAAHSGNDVQSVVRFKLQTGAEVRVVEARGNWLRIELPDGQQGWVEHQHAEVVVDG